MACGEKYAHLLVTEDGKTPRDPWWWYPGPMDYDEWYDVAHRIAREVFRRWHWFLSIEDKLKKLDNPQPAEPYPERDQLTFMLKQFNEKLDDLGHVLVEGVLHPEWTWEGGVRRAIAAGRDGTCMLELLDHGAEYYERPPVPHVDPGRMPGTGEPRDVPETSGGSGWGSVLVTGGLLAGGIALLRRKKRGAKGSNA